MSLPDTPDRILKALYLHLSAQCSVSRLRQLGWFDFRNHDRPDTADPVTMAHAAFVHLSLTEEGNWNSATDVLIAVIAYLRIATGNQATESDVTQFATLLREKPVRSQAVQDWFEQTFR